MRELRFLIAISVTLLVFSTALESSPRGARKEGLGGNRCFDTCEALQIMCSRACPKQCEELAPTAPAEDEIGCKRVCTRACRAQLVVCRSNCTTSTASNPASPESPSPP